MLKRGAYGFETSRFDIMRLWQPRGPGPSGGTYSTPPDLAGFGGGV